MMPILLYLDLTFKLDLRFRQSHHVSGLSGFCFEVSGGCRSKTS